MRPDRIEYPIEEIRGLIAAGWTQQKIADELARKVDPRITAKSIYKVCKKHGNGTDIRLDGSKAVIHV